VPRGRLQAQNLLTSANLPEVSSAHSRLGAYATALQEELSARQAALAALNAELAKQVRGQAAAAAAASCRCDYLPRHHSRYPQVTGVQQVLAYSNCRAAADQQQRSGVVCSA
jgi:hypothetical protein